MNNVTAAPPSGFSPPPYSELSDAETPSHILKVAITCLRDVALALDTQYPQMNPSLKDEIKRHILTCFASSPLPTTLSIDSKRNEISVRSTYELLCLSFNPQDNYSLVSHMRLSSGQRSCLDPSTPIASIEYCLKKLPLHAYIVAKIVNEATNPRFSHLTIKKPLNSISSYPIEILCVTQFCPSLHVIWQQSSSVQLTQEILFKALDHIVDASIPRADLQTKAQELLQDREIICWVFSKNLVTKLINIQGYTATDLPPTEPPQVLD